MPSLCQRLVDAARYLQSSGMTNEQLRDIHHSARRTETFSSTFRYFGKDLELSQVNLDYGRRLEYIADEHRKRSTSISGLVTEALEKWPVHVTGSERPLRPQAPTPSHIPSVPTPQHGPGLTIPAKPKTAPAAPQTSSTAFMKDLEARYKVATGFQNRSQYKIFYGPIHPARILVLGINPGGSPANTSDDGAMQLDGHPAAASASYYEGMEHDIVDCEWTENKGLRRLLAPLCGDSVEAIRTQVVKTNMAFRRSAKQTDIDIDAAIREAAPFLAEILGVVSPSVVILTGVKLDVFAEQIAASMGIIADAVTDPGIGHVVFAAALAKLKVTGAECLLVQVAHASQFSWTYERHGVAERIQGLLNN